MGTSIASGKQVVSGSVTSTVNITSTTELPTRPASTLLTQTRVSTSSSAEYTVPAGKKWIIVWVGSWTNTTAGSIWHVDSGSANVFKFYTSGADGSHQLVNYVVPAGEKMRIAYSGAFSYYEVDA